MVEVIELSNEDLNKKIFEDVMFFSVAEGGAMGEPGGVIFYNKAGKVYHLNYVFGDADIRKVERLFPVLSKCQFGMFGIDSSVPEGWNYIYLGMGNHLIVHDEVYPRFMELLAGEKDIYGMWRQLADTILIYLNTFQRSGEYQ